jgi:hypothetical protein
MLSVKDLIIPQNLSAEERQERARQIHASVANTLGQRGHEPFFKFNKRQCQIAKAMQKPLPGASADLVNGNLTVAGATVYEVVPTHIKAMQAVDSPLLKAGKSAMESDDKKSDADFEEEQAWELCYIFTTPPRDLRLLLKNGGVAKLRQAAAETWEIRTAAQINVTLSAIVNQYARHFQTTAKFAQEMEASGDVSFFRALGEKA